MSYKTAMKFSELNRLNAAELALRRQELRLQAAQQRMALRSHVEGIRDGMRPVLQVAIHAREGVLWAKRNPHWIVGALTVVAIVRPGVLGRVARRGLAGWQLLRQTQRIGRKLPAWWRDLSR